MRISYWSSDVCSSDLSGQPAGHGGARLRDRAGRGRARGARGRRCAGRGPTGCAVGRWHAAGTRRRRRSFVMHLQERPQPLLQGHRCCCHDALTLRAGCLGAKETAMLDKSYPYYIAGKAIAANTDLEVLDKYSGKRATRVAFADTAAVRQAIAAAAKAAPAMAAFPHDARRDVRSEERRVGKGCGSTGSCRWTSCH